MIRHARGVFLYLKRSLVETRAINKPARTRKWESIAKVLFVSATSVTHDTETSSVSAASVNLRSSLSICDLKIRGCQGSDEGECKKETLIDGVDGFNLINLVTGDSRVELSSYKRQLV